MVDSKIDLTNLAPIVLFVYNRPEHTRQTLEALSANDLADQSVLYVYADGPKPFAPPEEIKRIERVRQIVRSKKWCREVHVIESPYNMGQVDSFVRGVTEIVNQYGKVIVLEDDQVTSKGFLRYMNEALEIYKDDHQVMHVSGYMYPAQFRSEETTFFLNIQSAPGWGTWKRAWDHYNHDVEDHLRYFSQSRDLRKRFDIEGHARFFAQLQRNVEVKNYSFAVRWYASCFRTGGLSLFPAKSLVRNIGMDGTGVHCGPTEMYDVETVDYLKIERVPIVENEEVRRSVDRFFQQHLRRSHLSQFRRMWRSLKVLWVERIRKLLRWLLEKVFPELSILETDNVNWNVVKPVLVASQVSPKAKLYPPYRIHGSVIGDYTYIAPNSVVSCTHIGKFCSIGPNFCCGWGMHPVEGISTSPMFYSTGKQNGISLCNYNKVQERKPIRIGNDVFIGMNVTVLDGVTIGDGAVIGAGTVVSKDVPPYAIVVGNPMDILRYRFPEHIVKKLQEIAWWNWPDEALHKVEECFFDIEGFLMSRGGNAGEQAKLMSERNVSKREHEG